jgi:hypothetical protein
MTLQIPIPIHKPNPRQFFMIQVKVMTDEELKQYNRKKLYELSLNSLGEIPQLEEPNYEQKQWALRRLKQPAKYWQRWFVDQYFTKEQKKAMGLSNNNTARKGIK